VAAVLFGLGFGVLFVLRQRTLEHPLLDLRLFRSRAFSVTLVVLLLGLGVMGGSYLLIGQYLQLVEGLPPLEAGLWMLPAAFALTAASMLTPLRPGYLVGAALWVSVLGYVLLALVGPASGLPLLVVGFVLVYIGVSPLMALGTELIVGSAPPEKAGSAAASETAMEFGIAAGIAVMGSVATAVYRDEVSAAVPDAVPEAATAAARDTLAAAESAARELPGPLGAELLDAARAGFTEGLNTAGAVSAAVVAVLAVCATVMLRRVPPGGRAD
jgi:DHA2 family multidrug resistance protein-like MFS transporter